MSESNEKLSLMKKLPETAPLAAYIKLLKLMEEEEIKKEDLAIAC